MDTKKLKLPEMRPETTLDLYDLLAMKERREQELIEKMAKDAKEEKNTESSPLKAAVQRAEKASK